jgi:predicted nuclease with RNAse H fold
MSDTYVVGFDPGGKNAFGWAVLSYTDNQLTFLASGICSNARDSLRAADGKCPSHPIAVGIDAPLVWSESGDRQCDQKVRSLVISRTAATRKRVSSSVSHVNSLRGACLVQGILIAAFSGRKWPSARITEAHPKALRWIFPDLPLPRSCPEGLKERDHELDAVIAAYTAFHYAQKTEGWSDLYENETPRFEPCPHPVAYWFPS